MIDESKPYVGYLDIGMGGDGRYELRLITRESYGPLGTRIGYLRTESAAKHACRALEGAGVQNAGQLHSSGLRPLT